MADTILEAVREHKARSLARSADFSERREQVTAMRAELVKEVVLHGGDGTGLSAELNMRNKYYFMLEQYSGKTNFAIPTWNKRSESFWKRVVAAQETAHVPQDLYLKAQFHWFDKSFGKAPELKQLATAAAIARAKQFQTDASVNTDRKVVASAHKLDVSFADLMRQSETMVRQMCTAQRLSREEFYRQLVVPGMVHLPEQFLKADPIYRKVCDER